MAPLIDTGSRASSAPPSWTFRAESPGPAPESSVPPMRASDADRFATVAVLQDGVARGLLTPDEGSERMAAAFAAVHRRDLRPLTADLPPAPAATASPPGWRALTAMAVEQARSSFTVAATGRLHPARVAVAVLAALLLLLIFGSVVGELLFDRGGGGDGVDWYDRSDRFDRFDDD